MRKDIDNQGDVENLVRTFYGKVLQDELLSPHFEGIDFEHHFPRMIDFWEFLLLGKAGFEGNVFHKHKELMIGKEEFERWVSIFSQTVDSLFEGEVADKAKSQAELLGYTFSQKMSYLGLGKF